MVRVFQPYTADTTPRGLLVARNAMRQRLLNMTVPQAHDWLCHGDGSKCDGGLTCYPDAERLALHNSDHEDY